MLRAQISQDIFDYQTLLGALENYASPRDKISSLIKNGEIIRIKKGLYIFNETYRKQSYLGEQIANLIYGPSYISLEYALSFYGLIPEKVTVFTSVTIGRKRDFSTSIGRFTYRQIPMKAFSSGMDVLSSENNQPFLIATKEKALVDLIQSKRNIPIKSQKDMNTFLFDDLRLELADIIQLDVSRIEAYSIGYRSRKIAFLAKMIKRNKKVTIYA